MVDGLHPGEPESAGQMPAGLKMTFNGPSGFRNCLCFSLFLLVALAIFYFPWLSNRQSFYLSDLTYYYEPFLRFIGQALRANRLPLWNPYSFCGMPQIAIPSPGIFYPLDWLFAVLPFNPALGTYMIFHQLLAGIGAFLLIASLGWGAFAAAACGTTLALCGYMFSVQKNFSLAASAAWLPFTLWAVSKTGSGSTACRLVRTIVAALAIFMLVGTGRPEIALPSFLLVIGYIALSAYSAFTLDRLAGDAIKSALWRLSSVVLGVLIAMPIILPAVEWTALSPRSHGLSQQEALLWSSNWYDCLSIVFMQPLGDLNLIQARYLPLVATRPGFIPFLSSAFVGPVVFTLAIWGGCDRSWRGRWLLLLFLAGAMAATLGNQTPVFPWLLKHLPILGALRYPVKLLILPVWCLAFLAARGACHAVSARLNRRARLCTAIVWAAVLASGEVLVLTPALAWLAPQLGFLSLARVGLSLASAGLVAIGQSCLRAAAVGLATCATEYLYSQNKISRFAFAAAIVAGIAASMLACACAYSRHGTEPNFFERNSELADEVKRISAKDAADKQFRILPLYFDPLARPPWCHDKSPESTNALFYQYGRQLLLPNTNMDFGLPSSYGYEAAETADYRKIFGHALSGYQAYSQARNQNSDSAGKGISNLIPVARFCQITATRYVFTQIFTDSAPARVLPVLDEELFNLVEENRQFNFRIYRVNNPMRRAYLAGNWRWCDSQDQAITLVEKCDASGFDPASGVILEHKSLSSAASDPLAKPAARQPLEGSWLAFMQDGPEHVSLSVKTTSSCFLVLADHYYPGWHARLDGLPAELYRANAIQRAVFVRPGSHLIEFDYDPDSLYDGQKLAAIAFLIIAAMIGIATYIKLAESIRPRPEE